MKKDNKIILWIGIFIFICMLISLILMGQSLQNSELFDRYFIVFLTFNTIGLCILIVLILLNIRHLVKQVKKQVVGSKMTTRMVIIFSILSVTPVLIVYYFSLDFLHRGIDSWFDLRVEQALDDSLELSRLALDVRMRERLKMTESIAGELSNIDDASLILNIDKYRERINANELTILTKKGVIITSSTSDTNSLIPATPDEAILLQLLQGNSYIGLDIIKNMDLFIRVVVNLPAIQVDGDARIIQALFPISDRINTLAENVQSAYIEYKELSYLRTQLKVSLIIILTLVLLFSVLSAVWAAFYSASQLTAPIKNLAKGTHAVATGNYNTRLPVAGNDELGFLVASFNDMTDKVSQARDLAKKNQQQAESQRTYLETVLSCLSSGVMVFGRNKNLEIINISATQILGIALHKNQHTDIQYLSSNYPALNNFFACIAQHIEEQQNDWREQITLTEEAGEQILMVSGVILSSTNSDNCGHVIVFDEVTELIKGQRDAAWREIARRLAHEIKNPLTPIQLAADRLRHKCMSTMDKSDADTLKRMTNTIIQQVETMKEMINNFSDYARLPEFNQKEIKIDNLLRETLDLFSNLDHSNQINVIIEDKLPVVIGDEKKLRQVLNNILTNAVDANTANNNNYLKLIAKRITISKKDMIEIRIIDGGKGIPDKIKNKLFDPYMTTKPKGTGLGLAIVKRIMDEHKGLIWLEDDSNDQGGACAVIRLPAEYDLQRAS